jgi:hypothetical protein
VPGVWIGSHLSVRIPAGTLRTVLGVVLIGAGLGLASKAGAPIPPAVIGVVPVAIGVLVIAQRLRDRVPRREADTELLGDVEPAEAPP